MLTGVAASEVVYDYESFLTSDRPPPWCVADERRLPHPKETIKAAILTRLRLVKTSSERDSLEAAYVALASWQEGVGEENVCLDFTKIPRGDILAALEYVDKQYAEARKWTVMIEAETVLLRRDLQFSISAH